MRGLLTYSIVRADGQIMAATAVKKCRARGKKRGNMAGLAGLAGVGLSARQVPQKDSWQVRTEPYTLKLSDPLLHLQVDLSKRVAGPSPLFRVNTL